MERKKKFVHCKKSNNPNEISVDTAFRNDWVNASTIIGDEYFSVDI